MALGPIFAHEMVSRIAEAILTRSLFAMKIFSEDYFLDIVGIFFFVTDKVIREHAPELVNQPLSPYLVESTLIPDEDFVRLVLTIPV